MNEQDSDQDRLITAKMLANLPEPVQRYMAYSLVIGKPWTRTVRLKQVGRFAQRCRIKAAEKPYTKVH